MKEVSSWHSTLKPWGCIPCKDSKRQRKTDHLKASKGHTVRLPSKDINICVFARPHRQCLSLLLKTKYLKVTDLRRRRAKWVKPFRRFILCNTSLDALLLWISISQDLSPSQQTSEQQRPRLPLTGGRKEDEEAEQRLLYLNWLAGSGTLSPLHSWAESLWPSSPGWPEHCGPLPWVWWIMWRGLSSLTEGLHEQWREAATLLKWKDVRTESESDSFPKRAEGTREQHMDVISLSHATFPWRENKCVFLFFLFVHRVYYLQFDLLCFCHNPCWTRLSKGTILQVYTENRSTRPAGPRDQHHTNPQLPSFHCSKRRVLS